MAFPRLRIAAGKLTAAQVNAGVTVIPATPARMYRVVDCSLRAIGGNANATAVAISTTAASPVTIWTANLAALTENTLLRPSLASGGDHAVGAGFNANLTTGGGIKVKSTAAETSATDYEYTINYVIAAP